MSETTVHGPGTALVQSPVRSLVATVRSERFMEEVRLALPEGVTPERFGRAVVTALMQNEEIAKAEPDSIYRSIIKCAQDGLLPDGREAALVLFNNKKKGTVEAQYMSMIGGMRKIAGEQGWAIRTQVVYENDEFEIEMGLEPNIIHRPVRPGVERGPMVAAYAVGAHGDGRREIEVMSAADIAKVRASSRAAQFGPWKDWEERMWEKTVGRRLFKKLPLGERDAARVTRVIEASVEPEDAVEQLYGPEARAALMSPEGLVVDEAWEEIQGSEADATDALSAADQTPSVERAASDQSTGGEGGDGVAPDSERLAASVPEPPPVEIPEPVIPVADAPAVDERLLAQARKAKPPQGSYQDRPLSWIVSKQEATEWLAYALGKWPENTAFGKLLWCVVRADRPELIKEETQQ